MPKIYKGEMSAQSNRGVSAVIGEPQSGVNRIIEIPIPGNDGPDGPKGDVYTPVLSDDYFKK